MEYSLEIFCKDSRWPKGPFRTKNSTRSEFTIRSEFTTRSDSLHYCTDLLCLEYPKGPAILKILRRIHSLSPY